MLIFCRNLQEYRVRKAHQVIVKEEDMMKYLTCMLALTITGLTAWTLGSWADEELWNSAWPQCPMEAWSLTWQGSCELLSALTVRWTGKNMKSRTIHRLKLSANLITS